MGKYATRTENFWQKLRLFSWKLARILLKAQTRL
jgi:hypothetical protein